MTTRYAFSIDLDRCIGCQACTVACAAGNELADGETYIRITDKVSVKDGAFWGSFAHNRCFHCTDAPCVAACPTGTLTKWNGLTTVTMEKCSACGYCTDACPFHVPNVVDNHVSKCVACADLVQAGQQPWCERTCPSQAIRFGDRDALLADAKAKAAALKGRYPNAQVYGETQLGGLGLLLVLLDKPSAYGLPENPHMPAALQTWQAVVQPGATGLSVAAAGVMGLMFIIARRQHAMERAAHERQAAGADTEKNHD